MIVKGKSRGGAAQLATYLSGVGENETIELLELKASVATLHEAFDEWQTLAGGTKGVRGLYHANINPDAKHPMSRDQWGRAVDILERELGLTGQPRAVVMHDKLGRQHLHVVWQRTNVETMTMVSDSNNYEAHERGSLAMEREFGHELVPGKHAKKDATAARQQFKDEIAALFRASDNGVAFRHALEERGLVVAQGDRRDFVIVDAAGKAHSLARQIAGVSARDLRTFMSEVDAASLPNVEQATELQAERARQTSSSGIDPEERRQLEEALKTWQEDDRRKLAEAQASERATAEVAIDAKNAAQIEKSGVEREAALERHDRDAERGLLGRALNRVIAFVSPTWSARREGEREADRAEFVEALRREEAEELAQLDATKAAALAELAERHAREWKTREAQFEGDAARRVRDFEEAQRLAAQIDEQRRIAAERVAEEMAKAQAPPIRAR